MTNDTPTVECECDAPRDCIGRIGCKLGRGPTVRDDELVAKMAQAIALVYNAEAGSTAHDVVEIDRVAARAALEASGLQARLERYRVALEQIAGHNSGVSDNHMECGECKDAYLEPYCETKHIARKALGDSH